MRNTARTHSVSHLLCAANHTGAGRELKKSRFFSRRMLADMLAVFDCISIFAAGFAAKYFYAAFQEGGQLDWFNYASIMSLVALGFHFIGRQKGLYDTARLTNFPAQLSFVLHAWMATCASLFMVLFFMKISERFSRLWCLDWSIFLLLLLAAGRVVIIKYFQRMDRSGVLRRCVVLIGFGDQFSFLQTYINNDNRKYSLCAVIKLREVPQMGEKEVRQAIGRFARSSHEFEADDIMIALPPGYGSLVNLILQEVQKVPADVHIVPDFGGLRFPTIRLGQIGELSYLTTASKPIAGWGAFFKKAGDYLLAAIGLILLAPAMACIAAAIKLETEGPVFFRQRRHGYNHRIIEVLKFRSMTSTDDGDKIEQATRNDRRVTKVGRILRRTSLDELPQLINVLKGEMSIVGPRPHALAHNSFYGTLVENYANRHRVKPGITGWAQVHGFRGETGNPDKMAQRVRCDLEYIDNWSIWLDIKIILMTPIFGIFRNTAY